MARSWNSMWLNLRLLRSDTMRKIFNTAFFGLLAGFAGCALAQAESEQRFPPSEEIQETTAADREWDAWSEGLWCQLLEDPTPLVRIRAHAFVLDRKNGSATIDCPKPLPDTSDFRLQALLADPDNPALVAFVYRLECSGKQPATWCREADLRQKLLDMDPDNAFPHLLFLERAGSRSREAALSFSGEELEHLLAAASAKTLNSYYGYGMPEAFHALESAIADAPPPDWSADALAQWAELNADVNNPAVLADLASIQLMLGSSSDLGLYWMYASGIPRACRAAQAAGDDIAVNGCRALGQLATRNAHTLLGQSLGRALQLEPVERENEPPDWQSKVDVIVYQCSVPRGTLGQQGLPGPMPDGETLQWFQEIVDFGEGPAMRRKAAREFALYPEAFPLDPSRCEAIRSLSDSQQKTLADQWSNTRGADHWDAVLAAADAMLEAAD